MSAPRRAGLLGWVAAWRRSLGLRIVVAILSVSLVLGGAASAYDYHVEEELARQGLLDHAQSLARQAVLACPDAVISTDVPLLQSYVMGVVVGDKHVDYALVRRSRDGVVLAVYPPAAADNDDPATLVVREPILLERGGPELGTFVFGLSLQPMQRALRERSMLMLARSGLGFLLLAWLLWLTLKQVVVVPLHRLDVETQRLGRGELQQPIPDFGGTEIGRLGRTLDEMRASVHRSHESLAQQNRRLIELNELKGQFLANMSHEIRTPLTSILGGVELLTDAAASAHERSESAAVVQRNGEHLLDLVDRLLDLAKLEAGSLLVDRRPFRPDQVLAAVCDRYRSMLSRSIVELRLDAAAVAGRTVVTDPVRLRQMLAGVVGNAVKFTPAGRISVSATIDAVAAPMLRVVVEDTGTGIPAAFLPRLFEPFSQADGSLTRRHGGVGMGLAMARRIARQLGGDITVRSVDGKGTWVEIALAVDLPALPATPPSAAPRQAVPAAGALPPGRVLVVDDARDTQRLLQAMLTKAGVTVQLADNGREAVRAVQQAALTQPFDLVLMDLQMPELDGVSAIRALRAQGFDLPIVALTAHALAEDQERCLDAGASGYETKPITRQRLLEVVARHLGAPAAPA